MKRFDIALCIGLVFAIALSSFTAFASDCDEVRSQALRLHILANSDSEEDQALKLDVRDAVLEGTRDIFTVCLSKAETQALAAANLERIAAIAEGEIQRQGYDYPVTARIVNRFFDTRVYDSFTMPAGRYDAVQLEIGAGAGKNWWCVMFPPMCLPAAQAEPSAPLRERIERLGQRPVYKPAFAVVEVIEELKELFGADEKNNGGK